MTKRILVAALWFYTAWYLGAEIAYGFSTSPLLGPMLGVAAGILVLFDPGRIRFRTPSIARHSTQVRAATH
jgi:hypothetical protein